MFRFARIQDWWDQTRDPDLAFLRTPQWCGAALKTVGSAFVASQIKEHRPGTVLEFGHGDGSAMFDLFGKTCEMWGIDDAGPHVPAGQLDAFRAKHQGASRARFLTGYLGRDSAALPDGYFELVCSISVVEHIPIDVLPAVFREVVRVLKPGGLVVNSYDICYDTPREWVSAMFAAHVDSGLQWIEPRCSAELDWSARDTCFEDSRIVLNWYMGHLPDQDRSRLWPGNYGSVLMAARKPRP